MRTLDEVIETAPYVGTEWTNDALHYLKEYRETKKHLACLDTAEIRGDDTQVVNNPSLTWEELKTMEGKKFLGITWIASDMTITNTTDTKAQKTPIRDRMVGKETDENA